MTVFIEYVIIDNVIIDYLLLKATFGVIGVSVARGRLFLTAAVGALIALVYPLLNGVPLIMTAVKILSGFLLTLIATKYKSGREYYVCTLLFFALTFLVGGAITGVFSMLNVPLSTEILVAVVILPVYLIIRAAVSVITFLYRRKTVMSKIYSVDLVCNEKTVTARGFFDTGNALYYGNSPVIVCGKKLFFSIANAKFIRGEFNKICVATVNGKSENYCVKLSRLKIYIDGKTNIYNNVTLCLSENFSFDGYDVILHPALMEENENETTYKTKKIS